MNNKVFLLHHLGLGDHIICNGMVREISKKYETVFYPLKFHNILNVEKMFEDLNNIKFLPLKNDMEMLKVKQIYEKNCKILATGYFGDNFLNNNKNFCMSFYEQANIPYEKRWESFLIGGKLIKNTIEDKNYIFVHDDISRNLTINKKYLNNNIFRPQHQLGNKSDMTLFDYRDILLNSKEIHCMDSSFAAYIDHIPELEHKSKFIHRYVRKNNQNPIYKNNWVIIDE